MTNVRHLSTRAGPPGRLKVGLFIPSMTNLPRGVTLGWRDHVAFARVAEAVGFDSVWVADEMLFTFDDAPAMGWWDSWTLLSALAAATTRVTVGTLVTCTNYRNPALLARMAATVDEISSGRLILGLGAGYSERQFRTFGYPADHVVGRFEEALAIVHALLRDGRVTFEGEYQRAEDAPLFPAGPRPGSIPILVGGVGPRVLRLTARYADAWNLWLMGGECSIERAAPHVAALDAACAEVGRDPATLARSAGIIVALGDDPIFIGSSDWARGGVRGTPELIADRLLAFRDAGFEQLQIAISPVTVGGVEDFGRVLELLRERAAV